MSHSTDSSPLAVSHDTNSPGKPREAAAAVADGDKLAGASFAVRRLVIVDWIALHGRLVLHARLSSIQVQATYHATTNCVVLGSPVETLKVISGQ